MNQHIKALLVVIIMGAASVWVFNSYFMDRVHQAPNTVNNLDQMKTKGVPSFSGKTLSGEVFDLDQLKGKVVVLNFWASWCGPCVEEVPSLIKLADHFHGDIKVIAISADSSPEEIQVFLKSFPNLMGEHIKVVHDADRTKMKMFDISRLPESLILDKTHKLAKKISGSIDWSSKDSLAYIESLTKQ